MIQGKESAQIGCIVKSVEPNDEEQAERTITFVASSNQLDRHYEKVDVESLRLPLKGGGDIEVKKIGANGVDGIDIPLMLNHSFDVKDIIGSVRKAFYKDGELIFEAGISKREEAQEILQLIEEGHLDNAFSITMADFDYNDDSGLISNAEVLEVSVVFRGANKEARLLAVKSVEGVEIIERNEDGSFKATVDGEEVTLTPADRETEEQLTEEKDAEPENEENTEEQSEDESVGTPEETKDDTKKDGEQEEPSEESVVEYNNNNKEDSEMNEEIAKEAIVAPTATVKATSKDYLGSKDYLNVFTKAIINNKGLGANSVKAVLKEHLASKGITGDDILPAEISSIFFETWENQAGILSTFRNINARAAAMYAFGGEGEGIRAKGHKKGDLKAQQAITSVRRDLKEKIVYKRLDLDLQDLLDDTTGELLRFRVEELTGRVRDEIARGAVVGDGRVAPSDGADYRVFDGTRGLFSMASDIANALTDDYSSAVAIAVEADASDNAYDKIKKTVAEVRDKGFGKAVVVAPGTIANIELEKSADDGHYIITPGVSIEGLFPGVTVYEAEWMVGSGYDVIAYAKQGYALFGSDEMVRTAYNLDYNTDAMLVERAVAGSLFGYKACAGYPTTASA